MKKLIMFVMVLAIATPTMAMVYEPSHIPESAGCENSGQVLWEFLDEGCEPTSNQADPPYYFDPDLVDPVFGNRYTDGGPSWTWDSAGGDGIYTVDEEDSLNQPIPDSGGKIYMRMYFEVTHTYIENEDPSLIGMGLELWGLQDWTGCPVLSGNDGDIGPYLGGYEFPEATEVFDLNGGELEIGDWLQSYWVGDFSDDGSVWSPFTGPGGELEWEDAEFGLEDASHTTAIIGMGDFGGVGFELEEVYINYIWFNEADGSDIPEVPCFSIVGEVAAKPIAVDVNDVPIYEPQDCTTGPVICGPPPEGPTVGQLQVNLNWRPGEDPCFPNDPCYYATEFTATVVVDPNTAGDGPHEDFTFVGGDGSGNVTLIFDANNWDQYQNVYVVATEDLDREGNESYNVKLTVTIDIDDPNFGSDPCQIASASKGLIVVDNDIPYISVLPGGHLMDVLDEGLPGVPRTVNVTLSHMPNFDVYIYVTRESEWNDEEEGIGLLESMSVMDPNYFVWADPNMMHFTPANFNVNQQITLKALDDDEYVGDGQEWIPGIILFRPFSEDPRYRVPGLDAKGNELGEEDPDAEFEAKEVDFNVRDNDCGAWGFDPLDLNEDCVIDLSEIAGIYSQWLFCTDPYDDPTYGVWGDCDAAWNLGGEEEEE